MYTPRRTPIDWKRTVLWIVILAGCLAFWAGFGVGAWFISTAVGADENIVVQNTEVEMAAWLSQVTGQQVVPRPIIADPAVETCKEATASRAALGSCGGLSYPDHIEVTPTVWEGIVQLGLHGDVSYISTLIHENLHKPADVTSVYNEGVVEALNWDLQAAACYHWIRLRCVGRWVYDQYVRRVHTASARATGQPWKSRAARNWRKDLWRMDPRDRPAAMNAVLPEALRIPAATPYGS